MPYFNTYEDADEEMCPMDDEEIAEITEEELAAMADVEIAEIVAEGSDDGVPADNSVEGVDRSTTRYYAVSAHFKVDDLEDAVRRTYQALQERGATAVRCRYNGGGDEGFAHFDAAIIEGKPVPVTALAAELAGGPLGEVPEASRIYELQGLDQIPREQWAQEALDDFAFALASRLLGDGYGTGDYSMYCAFETDFSTGNIVDDPNVSDTYGSEEGTGDQE